MGFWGIEVKPGKPHPYHSDNVEGTLFVTQATLGLGKSTDRSILQCSVGHKSPIFLCSLLPDKSESCLLNLEFKDELVAFSVLGKRTIHLSGYFVAHEGDYLPDDYEPDSGEDIGETESDDEGSEFDYEDEDDSDDEFINDGDDDFNVFGSSPVPNSGVVIEEIEDDDQPTNEDGVYKLEYKKNGSAGVSVQESEDEDGFPVSTTEEGGKAANKESKKKKRKVKATTETDSQPEKKKKKKQKQKGNKETEADMVEDDHKELPGDEAQLADAKGGSPDTNEGDKRETEVDEGSAPSKSASKKNKKKKKNKKASGDGESTVEKPVPVVTSDGAKSSIDSDEKQSASKYSNVRSFPNGLVIEDLAMGKPDGKRASPGNQVSVQYIGKLKKDGKIFDSNVGRSPFKFRLGVGQVIKGWDVGVNGMRVGDKRRLTIPPAMGYGQQGAGNKIPPNSWLVFDVELKHVR